MDRVEWLEASYQQWLAEMRNQSHELLLEVDDALLERMGLTQTGDFKSRDLSDSRYFKVVQRPDKMMLFNDEYAVWIVPFEQKGQEAATFTWIALMDQFSKGFEMGFIAKGKYNSSKLVLRLLEQFLKEIEETEKLMASYEGGEYEKRD